MIKINREDGMKRHYVVLQTDGYYEADDKKDALKYLKDTITATHVIHTRSTDGNYYHDRVKVIAEK